MSKTKGKPKSSKEEQKRGKLEEQTLRANTSEQRIIAAARFQAGDRVCHTLTHARGTFVETHNGFALPECWVNFDSITASSGFIPRSCNPLELEFVNHEDCQCAPNLECLTLFQELAASPSQPETLEELTQPNLSKSRHSVSKSSKDIFPPSPSMTISVPLTPLENRGISQHVDFPATTSALPTHQDEDLKEHVQGSGEKCSELLSSPDPDSLSLKTSPICGIGDLLKSSTALPKSGMWDLSSVWEQPTLARPTFEKGCSLLPTPMSYSKGSGTRRPGQTKLDQRLRATGHIKPEEVLNPEVPLWMMGFPAGWLDLEQPDGGQLLAGQVELEFCEEVEPEDMKNLNASEMLLCPELPRSPSVESSTSIPYSVDRDGYLAFDQISTDGGTQSRAELNPQTLEEYAEAMDAGAAFPPILVFYDGEEYWLADGFHRVEAAKRLEWTDIAVEIRSGTRRDAVLYSVGANAAHGLRRTNADKRRAVLTLLNDDEWGQWSNREIAKRIAVDEGLIRKIKEELSADCPQIDLDFAKKCGSPINVLEKVREKLTCSSSPTCTVSRGSKTYTQDTAKIGKKPQPTTDFYQKDGVYMISAKKNPELRRFDGEWVVAKEVNEYSITIALRREDIPVSPQFLKEVDPEHWVEIQSISDRIDRLFQCELDPADDAVLEVLKRRTYFTERQKQLLANLENVYLGLDASVKIL